MAKSSLDYSELMGLNIALQKLLCIDKTDQDEGWVYVTEWMQERIKHLTHK